MNSPVMSSPCQPYEMHPDMPEPVTLWSVVDQLTEHEAKRMAIALAVHKPRRFEELLLEFWAARQA